MSEVTQILNQIESGSSSAAEQLLPLVYDELRKLAAAKLAQERPGQTLQPTALVHEAYLRLLGKDQKKGQEWNSQNHFFAAAAEAMRRILVDHARHKCTLKAGGRIRRLELGELPDQQITAELDVQALSNALDELQGVDSRAAELVKLRFFVGLSRKQAAAALGVSLPTADNDWAYAKSWLKSKLSGI